MGTLQKFIFLLTLMFAGCSSDMSFKLMAKQELKFAPITVIDNFFSLTYVENHAVAMGLMKGIDKKIRLPIILILQAIICLAGLFILWHARNQKISLLIGLAILLSGAFGNFIDRIQHGYVTDFFHFHYLDRFSFPVFNVADILINIGLVILLFRVRDFEKAVNSAFNRQYADELVPADEKDQPANQITPRN